MQPDDVMAWFARWKEMERAEIAELRSLPPEVKLRQLEALARSASLFDWSSVDRDVDRVRETWARLRQRSGLQ